ncbi:MAG: hypothetical protein K5790_10420 [Nitrosopumilus sp.]|uniref:hypothetical protein n=1 Tax=Nitrosopumilus sp. TaxID=2024843 RepID=UPI00247E7F5D|nr:hypothetical protein [Nitrosopumilus sp.]MCV0393684.1 hypothetical protein [Nitrosopumilus sp.]
MVFSRQVNATFYRGLGTKLLPFFLSLGAFLAISVYSFFDFKSVWSNPENFWLGIIFGFNALVFFFEGFGVLDREKNALIFAGILVIAIAIGNAIFAGMLFTNNIDFDIERGDLNKIASIFLGLAMVSHILFARFEILKGQTIKEALQEVF